MSIVVVGANHRTAPLGVLERLAIAPDDIAKTVAGLVGRDTIREAAVLATCGRTEIYLVAERFHGALTDVTELLAALAGMPIDELHPHLLTLHDDAAAAHLLEVAAGLDSLVLGESEILGQVRGAWQVAVDAGGARTTLDLLFRHAMRCGKRARTETGIARGTASISHAAVEIAAERLGTLAGRRVLVVGAGGMGSGVALSLRKAGVADITVANRTPERGGHVAARVGGAVVGLDQLDAPVRDADVVITCLAASAAPITADLLAERRQQLLIVDIALPRNVDAAVAELDGVTVLDLEDVSAWAQRGHAARTGEVEGVRQIVAEALDGFTLDAAARQAAPLVGRLHARAESIRSGELARYAARLGRLGDDERDAVDALTRAIVAKLLHEPSVRLRRDAGTPRGERNAAAVGDLFDLFDPGPR
jgi:glutamyl-tRNA reductase